MVAALGFVVGYAGTGTLSLGGVALMVDGTLKLAGIALNVGGALAIRSLTSSGPPPAATPKNLQINRKPVAGPRSRHYGIVKVSGDTIFHRAKNGFSYRVIVHGHGEISEIQAYYLNNQDVSVNSAGWVLNGEYQSGHNLVRIVSRLGQVPSNHFPELSSQMPEWTASHRLDGLSASLVICEAARPEEHPKIYTNGEPDFGILAKTSKLFDPRNNQTVYSDNSALAIADYIASPDGFNQPNALDQDDVAAEADVCDELETLATGGSERRYRIAGSYLLTESRQEVLGRMLESCAGRIRLKPNGQLRFNVGAWRAPEFTITFKDILEIENISAGPDILDRYNELPAKYVSQSLGYVEVDAEPYRDNLRVIEDGEILTGQSKDLLMCPTHRQARAVMKIHMDRDNPKEIISLTCKPAALPAIYESVISLDVPQMGLVGDYEVTQHELNFDRGKPWRDQSNLAQGG